MHVIDLRSLEKMELALSPEETEKGWSYISTYSLRELRDVLNVVRTCGGERRRVFEYVKTSVPNEYSEWEDRRVLEQLNALVNFGFIKSSASKNYDVLTSVLSESTIGAPLSTNDLRDFLNVYLSYFRFSEVMTWFFPTVDIRDAHGVTLDRLVRETRPLYSFATDKYTNRFLDDYRTPTTLYQIPDTETLLLRFWDLFVKWGKELGLLCRVSLSGFDVATDPYEARLSMVFFIGELPEEFDLHAFVKNNFPKETYIQCPALVLRIAAMYRITPERAAESVVHFCQRHRDIFSLERTSEAFIRPAQRPFYPKHRDSYISHLHILKR